MVWIGDLTLQLPGNQRDHARFHLVERAAGKKLGAVLGPDNMLQNQARPVLRGQFRGKCRDHLAGLMQADGAENAARGEVAVAAVHHLGADDEDRRSSGAQDRFSHRTDQ